MREDPTPINDDAVALEALQARARRMGYGSVTEALENLERMDKALDALEKADG